MEARAIIQEAMSLQDQMCEIRRELHRHPELGFDLTYTKARVIEKLKELGYEPIEMGRSGVVATIGKPGGSCILVRADMDALPINEEADVDYKSLTPGQMHGCGHDMHTAMLLGAAALLKQHEDELEGMVKLEFQPAEEIFRGSQDMIDAGILESPHVDAAFMMHVAAGFPMPSGLLMIPTQGGISMASCEQYHITVKGKGGHGALPNMAIDPITAAAHIHLALQEINSRELDPMGYGIFTTCRFEAGQTSNVIPDTAEMWGTIRTIDPEGAVTEQIHKRMTEIAVSVGQAMRCDVEVEFYDFCPCMVINDEVTKDTLKYMTELLGQGVIPTPTKPAGGSEDFAFISHKVPTTSMFISAGGTQEGYMYSQHNPKVRFNDSILYVGAAAYAYNAYRWLSEHK